MDISGAVVITLPDRVEVRRPYPAQKLFAGRRADEVAQMVGLLYSLCGQAQRAASGLALWGRPPEQANLQAVALEALREHALYLARWFPALKESVRGIAGWRVAESGQKVDALLSALELEGGGPPDFLRVAKNALRKVEKMPEKLPENAVESHFAADFSEKVLQSLISETQWVERPQINGMAQENSFHSRAQSAGVAADDGLTGRVASRLWDLWQWVRVLREGEAAFPLWGMREHDDWRLGWVETARGRLYHAAQVDGDCVVDYRICAPTEWNFHPGGVLAHWLAAQPAVDAPLARVMAEAVDPCVALEIRHA